VIAWRNGSTPEVIRPGVNGELVESIDEAVAAVRRIDLLDRARIRADFETRFSVSRQAEQYERLYRHQIQVRQSSSRNVVPMLHAA
jgi:glycosyltransferase involved in cell wall biosynthesis